MFPSIELTDPNQNEVAAAYKSVSGYELDSLVLERAYYAMSTWPSGQLATGRGHDGSQIRIHWEWTSGRQCVTVGKVGLIP